MDIETVRKLNLARHLYELGVSGLRSANDVHLFSTVNLLQDGVEAFLIAIADNVGAEIDQNTKFDKYFVLINEKIKPNTLPFKNYLLRLNRIRVDSKHYGIQPAREECERLALSVHEFFDQVCTDILGSDFSSISVIDLLKDGKTKELLRAATDDLKERRFEQCAINCRKALYLEIEKNYDISGYADGKGLGLLAGFGCKAPHFAKSKEYIEKNVHEPTDFIVYDHGVLNQDLIAKGVDNTGYWNVWRLTPSVYQDKDGRWFVKRDFQRLDKNVLSDNIEYIFSTTVDVVLSLHASAQAVRASERRSYYIDLSEESVPVYEKSDTQSKVTARTYPGMTRITTDYSVDGLNGDGPYWHVAHFEKDKPWLWGFIHNDCVK